MSQSLDPLIPVLRIFVWLVLLIVIFVPLERLFALHPQKIFRKAILTDVAYYFLSSLTVGFLLGAPLAVVAWLVHRSIPGAFTSAVAAWPAWLRIVAALVVGEVGVYWGHRWSHEIPFLWGFHAVHHSAEHVDFLVSSRSHPVDLVFTRLCGLIPMYVLGLAAPLRGIAGVVPVLVLLLGTIWGFFIHANVAWRFGWLEWIVSTPHFHHWHHTQEDHINRNYASMLPIMDVLFGTSYLPKRHWPAKYGIQGTMSSNVFGQLIHPFLSQAQPRSQTALSSTFSRASDSLS